MFSSFLFLIFSFSPPCLCLFLKVFDWSYFTAKIMDTVNISVPDTEKVINYSPNYYRRLNLILARYSKRSVCMSLYSCLCIIACLWVCVCGGVSTHTRNENSCLPVTDMYWSFVSAREFLWTSFHSSQGSAELHGVAFCYEHGGGPEQSLQGHQEGLPKGTLPGPWHWTCLSINARAKLHLILEVDTCIEIWALQRKVYGTISVFLTWSMFDGPRFCKTKLSPQIAHILLASVGPTERSYIGKA